MTVTQIFSYMRGTEQMMVGRTSRMYSSTSSVSKLFMMQRSEPVAVAENRSADGRTRG